MSGTAIKAVVAYVSDYVTKPGLKTHALFDAIRSIFERNTELLAGSLKRKDKARKIITQTVNCLTAKMEIGGPMAALYLLGHPDHYTSHKYVPVYWKNYVREVHDYMYRPKAFEDETLCEWVQMSSRIKLCKAGDAMESEDELDNIGSTNSVKAESGPLQSPMDDIDDESENEETEFEHDTDNYCFLKGHPLYKTHGAQFDETKCDVVPNFVGGSLPRCDRGDREYYCATMLTLFKPWRSGTDLKENDYSWDETFNDYSFTEQQKQFMKNFNIRYECNDARDDYAVQMKRGDIPSGVFPEWMNSDVLNELGDDDTDYFEGANFGCSDPHDEEENPNKYTDMGKYGISRYEEMEAIRIGVKEAGWLDPSPNGINPFDTKPIQPNIMQSSSKWKAVVSDKRQEVLAERNKHIPENRINRNSAPDPNENNVQIVDQAYLTKDFVAKEKVTQSQIDTTIKDYALNTEQERAFRIVANHAVSPKVEQLKMYLGGMGGTGKSRVIQALTYFFKGRNESHRFVTLGPTGTSAALLNGSTYHSFLVSLLVETKMQLVWPKSNQDLMV
ncbi:hypothetical protein BDZ94DRAFT_1377103 [Collybia nuda]|uniref:ATP-dependent DNA helicase n=1 Tax=Collybia nuda TaxID=64659 RepID=A0A9P6CH09_9AGAR|nr:hypothetical protein BDZ94DRAFT_1377103 [Collybia nuda]